AVGVEEGRPGKTTERVAEVSARETGRRHTDGSRVGGAVAEAARLSLGERVVARDDGELVVALRVTGRSTHDVAAAVAEGDAHTGQAGLVGALGAIAVGVDEHAAGDQRGARRGLLAKAVAGGRLPRPDADAGHGVGAKCP